jgi:hypothetical protein
MGARYSKKGSIVFVSLPLTVLPVSSEYLILYQTVLPDSKMLKFMTGISA